jgi:lipoyl-dependent peroxiredoxin
MAVRTAEAIWNGNLRQGSGTMKFGTYEGSYTWSSRFEEAPGTNPEQLLGAAHAGCFSMSVSSRLTKAGFTPTRIDTTARVHIDDVEGTHKITLVELQTEAEVPGLDDARFQEIAEAAKNGCPVSMALAGTKITMNARLVK